MPKKISPDLPPPCQPMFYCDAHVDTLSKMLKNEWSNLQDIPRDSHVTVRRLRQSPAGLIVFACFTEKKDKSLPPLLRTLRMIAIAHEAARKNSDWLEIIPDSAAFQKTHKNGKIALVLSLENGIAVEEDLSLLSIFHRLGVRLMGLTWNHRNRLGDGVGKPGGRRGLTALGREALCEMERLGIIVDVSHLSERTFWDVLESTTAPIVATHSNAFSLCPHPRNLTDPQIRAIAERKGFIGLNFCGLFLKQTFGASIADVVKHASHIAEVGGPEVLAIGSDYDGIIDPPAKLEHIGKVGSLVAALRKAGFSQYEIGGIMQRNFLRVFKTVCG
jgi:membrane dipeptidase